MISGGRVDGYCFIKSTLYTDVDAILKFLNILFIKAKNLKSIINIAGCLLMETKITFMCEKIINIIVTVSKLFYVLLYRPMSNYFLSIILANSIYASTFLTCKITAIYINQIDVGAS